nr:hypothetical protein L203_05663 [Cryptococcus depauperatus CBS 7841]
MAQNYDKIVKLACKPKNAPPKAKYIDALISATYADNGSIIDIARSIALRLRDQNGIVVFKALLTLHQMIRTGSTEALLDVLARGDMLKLRSVQAPRFSGCIPPASMSAYADYLDTRIRAFRELDHDLVRVQTESNRRSDGLGASSKARRLRHLPVEKGLLREVKQVQKMLDSLLKCKFYDDDLRDENTVLAFRLLIKDLLVLFQAGNEGVCNILEHYFEMSKHDAQGSFDIYKHFIAQTDRTVDFLSISRKLHHVVNVPVPNLKHAPTSLVQALDEYLNDPNFEQNRIDYKKSLGVVKGHSGTSSTPPVEHSSSTPASEPKKEPVKEEPKPQRPPGASQKINDFFESIQTDQQPTMFDGPAQQMNYAQMTINQSHFNPFRQSVMAPQQTGFIQPQMTGFSQQAQLAPFLQPQQTGMMAFGDRASMFIQSNDYQQSRPASATPHQGGFVQAQQISFLQPQPQPTVGSSQPYQPSLLQPQTTGFNPFRQSMMVGGGGFSSSLGNSHPSPFASNGISQIQRPGSTPAFVTTPLIASNSNASLSNTAVSSHEPKPLVAQQTGSKNPFAPIPGSTPPVPKTQPQDKQPTMNELLMGDGADVGNHTQLQSYQQGQQQQVQMMQEMQMQALGMGDVASSFVKSEQSQAGGTNLHPQFSSLSVNSTSNNRLPSPSSTTQTNSLPFLSANSTGLAPSTSISSQLTGISGLSNNTNLTTNGFLQPQQTGFGGSNVKPFKPASNFGSQLVDSLPPINEPSSSASGANMVALPSQNSLSDAGGARLQNTGLPSTSSFTANQHSQLPQQQQQGLTAQLTGANPFRQSMFPNMMSSAGQMGGAGIEAAAFGTMAGREGTFAHQGQNQRHEGQGQFGMFGQNFSQQQNQQGGSLI